MEFKRRTVEAIADMIVGDNKKFEYRTGTHITRFFHECGLDFTHDGSTRSTWTADKLIELLNKPSTDGNVLPDKFIRVLHELMDKRDALDGDEDRSIALAELNKNIKWEGYEAYYVDDITLQVKNFPHSNVAQGNTSKRSLIFLSHLSTDQKSIAKISDSFKHFNIDSFLAHKDIEPSRDWQIDIRNNLNNMDMLLAFITDDFHCSSWTNQEIGYALGRDVKIGRLKFCKGTPEGFIGREQAQLCAWEDINLFEKILQYILKNKLLPENKYGNLYARYHAYAKLFGDKFIAIKPFSYNTINAQDAFVNSNVPSSDYTTLFVNNYHNDYGYHTSCKLYKGKNLLADIKLGNNKLKKSKFLDSLMPKNIFLLNNNFFSYVWPSESLSEDEILELKLIFNHYDSESKCTEDHPDASDLISKSLFRTS